MATSRTPRRLGVLLAAGRGRRMGGAKQFHPVETPAGQKPLVAASFDAIRPICAEMIVVVGHRAEEVIQLLEARKFRSVVGEPDAAMFHSLCLGLQLAQQLDPDATVVLHLGDHPRVNPATLEQMIQAAQAHPRRAVFPEYDGKGGHPALIPPEVVAEILTASTSGGLRQFWRDRPELCLRLPVDDRTVIADVDTPDAPGVNSRN